MTAHRAVDRRQLVRERFNVRGAHGGVGVEQMCELDPECLRIQPERISVAIKRPAAARRDFPDPGLVLTAEDPVAEAVRSPPRDLYRVRAVRTRCHDLDRALARDPRQAAAGNNALELHRPVPVTSPRQSTRRRAAPGRTARVAPMCRAHFAAVPPVRIATSSSTSATGLTGFALPSLQAR